MKLRGGLTNIFLQLLMTIFSGFMILTQMGAMRQPSKLLIQLICIMSIISLILAIWNYVKEDKD